MLERERDSMSTKLRILLLEATMSHFRLFLANYLGNFGPPTSKQPLFELMLITLCRVFEPVTRNLATRLKVQTQQETLWSLNC